MSTGKKKSWISTFRISRTTTIKLRKSYYNPQSVLKKGKPNQRFISVSSQKNGLTPII